MSPAIKVNSTLMDFFLPAFSIFLVFFSRFMISVQVLVLRFILREGVQSGRRNLYQFFSICENAGRKLLSILADPK
jgi:hypothetical protein